LKLKVFQVALVWFGTCSGDYLIVFAPDNEHRRLVVAEVLLPTWIERGIRAIAVKQLKLNIFVTWAIHLCLVVHPAIGRDRFQITHASLILPFGCANFKKRFERSAVCLCFVFPEWSERLPEFVV